MMARLQHLSLAVLEIYPRGIMARPKKTPETQEIEDLQKQFDAYEEKIKALEKERSFTPPEQGETQTKIAKRDIDKDNERYIKPQRRINSKEKFNEKFRADYEKDCEYVNFIAENVEILGESICMWTKPYPGMPAEYWEIPVNKPVWAPRYVRDQIKRKFHHILRMQDTTTHQDGVGSYYGSMVVDQTKERLRAVEVPKDRPTFMGIR